MRTSAMAMAEELGRCRKRTDRIWDEVGGWGGGGEMAWVVVLLFIEMGARGQGVWEQM